MSQWLCVLWAQNVVEPAEQFVGANREIEHTALRQRVFKPLSYIVSRGRVAPVVRTPQLHQTQAATVCVADAPAALSPRQQPDCVVPDRDRSIEQSHETAR